MRLTPVFDVRVCVCMCDGLLSGSLCVSRPPAVSSLTGSRSSSGVTLEKGREGGREEGGREARSAFSV